MPSAVERPRWPLIHVSAAAPDGHNALFSLAADATKPFISGAAAAADISAEGAAD